jgi:hypothetical protein
VIFAWLSFLLEEKVFSYLFPVFLPAYSANMWNKALNKQLGTEVRVGFSLFFFCVFIKFVNKRRKSLRQREERIRK